MISMKSTKGIRRTLKQQQRLSEGLYQRIGRLQGILLDKEFNKAKAKAFFIRVKYFFRKIEEINKDFNEELLDFFKDNRSYIESYRVKAHRHHQIVEAQLKVNHAMFEDGKFELEMVHKGPNVDEELKRIGKEVQGWILYTKSLRQFFISLIKEYKARQNKIQREAEAHIDYAYQHIEHFLTQRSFYEHYANQNREFLTDDQYEKLTNPKKANQEV
jgi:hypothetical protein